VRHSLHELRLLVETGEDKSPNSQLGKAVPIIQARYTKEWMRKFKRYDRRPLLSVMVQLCFGERQLQAQIWQDLGRMERQRSFESVCLMIVTEECPEAKGGR
jgi:hypothetical protein